MAITGEELEELIESKGDIEKKTTISSDGKTFLTRIPKELVDELQIKKGDKFMWSLNRGEDTISLTASGAMVAHIGATATSIPIQDEKKKENY
jgi:hypothetical protein